MKTRPEFDNSIQIGGQPPSHQNDLAFAGVTVQSNDGLEGLWRNVPRRPKVRHNRTVDREEFCDLLLIGTSNITTAHGASLHRALGAHACPVYRFWSPEDLRALMPRPSVASDSSQIGLTARFEHQKVPLRPTQIATLKSGHITVSVARSEGTPKSLSLDIFTHKGAGINKLRTGSPKRTRSRASFCV